MIVTDPDKYLLPAYRLSPFSTSDISKNNRLKETDDSWLCDDYFTGRFQGRQYIYTHNGRVALNKALNHYSLQKDDVVTIYTTTGNKYISSCVTSEIEKFCRWSRAIEPKTRVVLVNHEFGFPYEDIIELKAMGYPIIEDCAYSFSSTNEQGNVGLVGDFTVYSFPKYFPIQVGGLLTYKKEIVLDPDNLNDDHWQEEEKYIKKVLSHYLNDIVTFDRRRRENYRLLLDELEQLGCKERVTLKNGDVPGVCLFSVPGRQDLVAVKEYLWDKGIQCSIFYGEQTFFVPVHNFLEQEDLTYILSQIQASLKEKL